MADQARLPFEDPPKARRTGSLRSYHVRSHVSPAEALAGEARAEKQEEMVLHIFREARADADDLDPDAGLRLTPSRVLVCWGIVYEGRPKPLLTSIRRALTNLTTRGPLVHYPSDRRPGPYGAAESTWGLAPDTPSLGSAGCSRTPPKPSQEGPQE